MVNDLLDVSRITKDKIRLQRESADLGELVARAGDTVREMFTARGQKLLIETPTRPVRVLADAIRLEQVVGNLMNNASKFTPHGGHVWITVERAGAEAVIRVRDDGEGIDGHTLPHVFEMFRQGDTSLERAHGGLGIGLTLVRQLVELHGGTVEARSAGAEQGAEFVVRLPIESGPAAEARTVPAGAAAQPARPLRILIVDDNVDAADVVAVLLRVRGHEVAVAHSGAAGIDRARALRPEAALIDLGMPLMNGFEVAQRLRGEYDGRLFLIAVSGYSSDEIRRRVREARFDEYLGKPYDLAQVEALLARVP
jgi:CheY-like chemotaxis protein